MMLVGWSCGSPEVGVALWAVSCTLNAFSEGNVSLPFILPTGSLLLHAVITIAAKKAVVVIFAKDVAT